MLLLGWGSYVESTANSVEPNRAVDVFEFSVAKVVEQEVCLSTDLFERTAREAYASRLALILHTCRYVDAVAKNVVAVYDDLANIDTDSESDPMGGVAVAFRHFLLHRHRAGHGINNAGELDQHAIARRLDDAAVIRRNRGIDDLAAVRFQGCERADLISAHQSRVARDIGCKDGCKPALDPRLGHLVRSGPAS